MKPNFKVGMIIFFSIILQVGNMQTVFFQTAIDGHTLTTTVICEYIIST